MSDLNLGNGAIEPLEVNGIKYGVSICYEDAYGSEMLAQFPKANVLINISNDAWFGDRQHPAVMFEGFFLRASTGLSNSTVQFQTCLILELIFTDSITEVIKILRLLMAILMSLFEPLNRRCESHYLDSAIQPRAFH